MSKSSCEAAESARGTILRMGVGWTGTIQGNFGKNQLTHAEPYNIIFNCDELFINVWPKPRRDILYTHARVGNTVADATCRRRGGQGKMSFFHARLYYKLPWRDAKCGRTSA